MSRTLLIADDIRSNREILKNMLCKDYDFLEASNGEEALSILKDRYLDISAVLLDIAMPGLDGYQVLRRIRTMPKLSTIPIVMITGSDDEESRVKSLSLGANDFVMKPYSSEIIKHCLVNNIAYHEAEATISILQRDKLTGLYSREPFFEKVQAMVTANPPGTYVMTSFDIEKFKVINDQYGTQKGDEVLRSIAEVFREGFLPHGGICGRIAEDNFAVLYPLSFMESEEIVAIRERAARFDGIVAPIIFTIGRYIVDDIYMSPSAMYDRASIAANSIKGRFDTRVAIYEPSMRKHLINEQEIVQDMEEALRDGQFEPWFQPQYNHSTGAMVGAEALVRWLHPSKGLIPPMDFIPIFEKNGFIYEMDKYIWEQVCLCLRKWLDMGRRPLPVSVNISRKDMLQPDLVEFVSELMSKYDLPKDLLRLEVTESAFSKETRLIVDVVKQFIRLGFTVEIDDFGTGYSSLNTLKEVPAQILKLDMKFFSTEGDTQRGGNIVESIVRMAKWLGMSVIAEGVETKAQADFLRSIGGNYIQGYLYAKPMPITQYEDHCKDIEKEENLIRLETVENLDNNAFWDAQSMDTLIFNSYVGAASIFEFHNGNVEVIRATEKYAQVMGGEGMTVEDALKISWSDHLDEESNKRAVEAIQESVATKKEVTDEYVFLDLPGCPHETHIRTTMKVIATAGDRYLVYCTNENITAQRQLEQKQRETMEQLQTMMDDIPGGFVRMIRYDDGTIKPIYFNKGFLSLVNMSKEQLLDVYKNDALAGVHPEDVHIVDRAIKEMEENGQARSDRYRIRYGSGGYIWIIVFGRQTTDKAGRTYLNIYYTEATTKPEEAGDSHEPK